MQPAPEQRLHLHRLRGLASRFRRQERGMVRELLELQRRLDQAHRDSCVAQLEDSPDLATRAADCQDLQLDYDELATELVHVRLAIAGADEELRGFGHSRPLFAQRLPA